MQSSWKITCMAMWMLLYISSVSTVGFSQMTWDLSKVSQTPAFSWNGNLVIVISTHVDDSLIGSQKSSVEGFYAEFSMHLKIEKFGRLKKHLGVWWEWHTDDKTKEIYLKTMPKMLQEIKMHSQKQLAKTPKAWTTLAYPSTRLTKASETKGEWSTWNIGRLCEK